MKNVTISMDDETLAWVRLEAARAGVSVSRWIAGQLTGSRSEDREKAAARERIEAFLAAGPYFDLSVDGKITIDRDELYDDGRFRRFDDPALHGGPERSGEADAVRHVAEAPARYEPPRRKSPGSE
jgi:hypothetical protein